MDIFNQASDMVLSLTFTDETGNAVTPSAARYRIDVQGGNAITSNGNNSAWVGFTPSSNAYDLAISANQNAMANDSTDREERVVTVEFTYSANNKILPIEYRYMLQRLPNLLKP